MLRKALSIVLLAAILSSCNASAAQQNNNLQGEPALGAVSQVAAPVVAVVNPVTGQMPEEAALPERLAPLAAASPTPTKRAPAPTRPAANTPTSTQPLGPDTFPEGVNPLSGLRVEDPAKLSLAPALVSVTNFPVTARPQAGLSYSPFVFEMYIGEGMTRFLAVFYGDYPQKTQKDGDAGIALSTDGIGPVRSGRLPYESLRKLYNGFLVMASASSNVLPSLGSHTNVYGTDSGDINSALIPASRLAEIASKNPKRLDKEALTGLKFDAKAPLDGKSGKMLWIPYNFLNQVIWRYDAATGAYLRYQDNADGKTFIQATDRLNGSPLTYENVVILFAAHEAKRETLVNIHLEYISRMPALLFRDGKMYEIYWSTANGEYERRTGLERPMRFMDANGDPFPLKPGQTWVEIVQSYTRFNETVDSELWGDLKNKKSPGSGIWAIHFFPTVPERK